jgi:hypothetical protein
MAGRCVATGHAGAALKVDRVFGDAFEVLGRHWTARPERSAAKFDTYVPNALWPIARTANAWLRAWLD